VSGETDDGFQAMVDAWLTEGMRQFRVAQISEDNVATIDGRKPRRATIRPLADGGFGIIYEEQQ
jgi:hypothetical protein